TYVHLVSIPCTPRLRSRAHRYAILVSRLRAAHGAPRPDPRRQRSRPARLLRARGPGLHRLPHGRAPPPRRRRARRASGPGGHRVPATRPRRPLALSRVLLRAAARQYGPADHEGRQSSLMPVETRDVVVIGTGFGGSIPGYYLAAGGASVVMLERGPRLGTEEFTHDLQIGTYTRIVDLIRNDGVEVAAGNCVGGSSVVYFAASLRSPSFVFDRSGKLGRRIWPATISRRTLDHWYERVERNLPVSGQAR